MLTALIIAGGKGTRFFPISTEDKPKQFLSLIDSKTMLEDTVDRLLSLIEIDKIFICTGEKYKHFILEQLPNLPERNIIIEPVGKNTAPCILLGSLYINQIYNNANIIVLPSDHKINDNSEFLSVINDANIFINNKINSIVTIGISPNRPETGYGYINYDSVIGEVNHHEIKKVKRFVEKPNLDLAKTYLDDGHYLWNAGMFMFNIDFINTEFSKYYKDGYELLSSLPSINEKDYYEKLVDKYNQCEAISIDYAIMEKSQNIYVIPADFGWDDIGSWKAIERYINKDENNNLTKGNAIYIDANNNIVYGNKKIVLEGVDGIYCIESSDVIVIGKKENINNVHNLRGKIL